MPRAARSRPTSCAARPGWRRPSTSTTIAWRRRGAGGRGGGGGRAGGPRGPGERCPAGHQTQPFFYSPHLFEPHTPYDPPEPFRTRYASRPYDGEIAAADAIVGRFLDYLKRSG